jgi:hypothetical protein
VSPFPLLSPSFRTAVDEAEDDSEFDADDLEKAAREKYGTIQLYGDWLEKATDLNAGAGNTAHLSEGYYWEGTKTGTYVDGVVRYISATGGAAERPVTAGVANHVRSFEGAGPKAGFTLQRGMTLLHHACRRGSPAEVTDIYVHGMLTTDICIGAHTDAMFAMDALSINIDVYMCNA